MRGHECYYVGADDTHGTPIMLKAQAEGIAPEALIDKVNGEHRRDLADMLIGFDNYGSTHSPETRTLCDRMYLRLRERGCIDKKSVRQAYDESAKMFLPDRYVKGICPVCGTADQYGDSCENCGSTYTPADLKNPISVVSGTPPVWRESEHYFFKLSAFEERLAAFVKSGAVQESVARKLEEWFSQGLKDWDISRDAPYFGFEIPDAPGKYFYVWFDAPIGYLGSFAQLCERTGVEVRRLPGRGFSRRAAPLHRQGHPVLPLAVLARGARGRRDEKADQRPCARLFDHQRPEDVQIPGHFRHRAPLSRHPRAGVSALLFRREARSRHRRSRSQPG